MKNRTRIALQYHTQKILDAYTRIYWVWYAGANGSENKNPIESKRAAPMFLKVGVKLVQFLNASRWMLVTPKLHPFSR